MHKEITESFLQVVAGDIEKLLLENRETINFSFAKIPDGIKISLGISLDPASDGIIVIYDLGFDLEPKPKPPTKYKIKLRHVINEAQLAFEGIGKDIREGEKPAS